MRIIHGELSGRRLHIPKHIQARPTTDLARESLFNILNNRLDYTNLVVLDLFSGTGAISYEFASLGASEITCIENNFKHATAIKQNCDTLRISNILVVKSDVFKYLSSCQKTFDVIFADPPYDLPQIADLPGLIMDAEILKKDGFLIIEHGPSTKFTQGIVPFETRHYGKVHFSFFSFN